MKIICIGRNYSNHIAELQNERPDEPVTAGAPMGPGPGMEALGMSEDIKQQSGMDAMQLATYLPALEETARIPGTPPSFVRFVRYLRSQQ
jgi:hypothetical protein